jgi:aspartate aminotransferase
MRERTITTMGLTKTFSMGGWRVGLVHATPERAAAMTVLQAHLITCASSIAQAGAAAALRDAPRQEVLDLWQDWGRRCRFVAEQLAAIPGLRCAVPEGGFYAWVDVRGGGWNAEALAERLLRDHHVAVVPGAPFGAMGEGHLRITCVQSWADIREAVDRIGKALRSEATVSAPSS